MRLDVLFGFLLPLLYWGMVGYTLRRTWRQGKHPRLSPEIREEKSLQIGWYVVVVGWFGQVVLLALQSDPPFFFRPLPALDHTALDISGLILGVAGLVATRWSQRSMGRNWRMWIDSSAHGRLVEDGPYRWIRHPIYGFQILVIVGTWCLLPTTFLACIIALHLILVVRKSLLEERHLLAQCAEAYPSYQQRTGMFWPIFRRRDS